MNYQVFFHHKLIVQDIEFHVYKATEVYVPVASRSSGFDTTVPVSKISSSIDKRIKECILINKYFFNSK